MVTITTIKDTNVTVQISRKVLNIIEENRNHLHKIPESLYVRLTKMGVILPMDIQKMKNNDTMIMPKSFNVKVFKKFLTEHHDTIKKNEISNDLNGKKTKEKSSDNNADCFVDISLNLIELQWLNDFLQQLRNQNVCDIYLNDVLKMCRIQLPQNEILPRNPELEARCQRLREEQENLEYFKMTKNVNSTLRSHPEDTIAYQLKAINSQIIAVLQFIFSVLTGFVFGFLGIELIFGNIDFGMRLLLGIMFALIIALAEIYFLAKKLSEYDATVDNIKKLSTPIKVAKKHSE